MAAAVYFWLVQFVIAIIFLLFASYSDIKIRKVSDIVWVSLGMFAIMILGLKIAFEPENMILNSLALIPVVGIFSYFLLCEWVFDFEEKQVNLPWLMIIIISVLIMIVSAFWTGFNFSQIFILFLFLIIFISIEFYMFYLDYQDYKETVESKKNEEELKKKKEEKSRVKKIPTKSEPAPSTTKSQIQNENKTDYINLSSWIILILFIIHAVLGSLVYNFWSGNATFELSVAGFGILIPIAIFISYIIFYEWSLFPDDKNNTQSSKTSSTGNGKTIEKEDETETEFEPRPRSLSERIGWAFIIILGFFVIISALSIFTDEKAAVPKYYPGMFSAVVWLVIFYAFYNWGIPKGGADTKALMALAILFPTYTFFSPLMLGSLFIDLVETFPGIGYLFPFAFTVLINATIVTIPIPLFLIVYNASKKDLEFPQCAFGYKMDLSEIPESHVWLMDRVDEDNKLYTVLFPGNSQVDLVTIKQLRKLGQKHAWVTPKIPFIIPMTVGFVMTFIIGNILLVIISWIGGF